MTGEGRADRAWIVLGASSSVARAFAREAAADGADILLAGRDREDLERTAADLRVRTGRRVEVLDFDATDADGHGEFAQSCDALADRLDVFLAFGSMPSQAEMDADPGLAIDTIAVNYAGAVSILSHLAPLLEARGRGSIVALSSVAGDRGRLKNYVYGSAKAGLNAYLQGLRARLHRHGVTVTTIKPGFLDTAMSFGHPGMFLVASPEGCAAACLRHAKRGREVAYFPAFWWGIMTLIRLVPERLFKRLNI